MFKPDPFVVKGYLNTEMHEARTDHGKIVTQQAAESFDEFRIVVFRASDRPSEVDPESQAAYVNKLAEAGTIVYAATFTDEGSRHGIWVAKPGDDLKEVIESAPAVRSGIEYRAVPLYVGKGTFQAS